MKRIILTLIILVLLFSVQCWAADWTIRTKDNTNLVGEWSLGYEDYNGTTVYGLGESDDLTAVFAPTLTTGHNGGANQALSFNGTNQYLVQKVYDTQIGTLTFVADGVNAEFRDSSQDFSDWETTLGNASHMLVVTSNNGVSWSYCGASNNSGTDIDCYSDKSLTTRGWKTRETPDANGDIAASYEIRKTDFQL